MVHVLLVLCLVDLYTFSPESLTTVHDYFDSFCCEVLLCIVFCAVLLLCSCAQAISLSSANLKKNFLNQKFECR